MDPSAAGLFQTSLLELTLELISQTLGVRGGGLGRSDSTSSLLFGIGREEGSAQRLENVPKN